MANAIAESIPRDLSRKVHPLLESSSAEVEFVSGPNVRALHDNLRIHLGEAFGAEFWPIDVVICACTENKRCTENERATASLVSLSQPSRPLTSRTTKQYKGTTIRWDGSFNENGMSFPDMPRVTADAVLAEIHRHARAVIRTSSPSAPIMRLDLEEPPTAHEIASFLRVRNRTENDAQGFHTRTRD